MELGMLRINNEIMVFGEAGNGVSTNVDEILKNEISKHPRALGIVIDNVGLNHNPDSLHKSWNLHYYRPTDYLSSNDTESFDERKEEFIKEMITVIRKIKDINRFRRFDKVYVAFTSNTYDISIMDFPDDTRPDLFIFGRQLPANYGLHSDYMRIFDTRNRNAKHI
jgi:hypothetical protein